MSFQLPQYIKPDFKKEPLISAADARWAPSPCDGAAPENYHATTIFPEYFKIGGNWRLAAESRMDCVAVLKDKTIDVVEFRNIKKGDHIFIGRSENGEEGILVYPHGFLKQSDENDETFAFRQRRSRETAFSKDYDSIYELLQYEKDYGNILWVMGPACTFDADSRESFAKLIRNGYVHGVLAGNALATHDLEAAYKGTALGQDIYTQKSMPQGHYNHIDTINKARLCGSIPSFITTEHLDNGIICACVEKNIPFVLAGSIRDDGPLPGVYADVYKAQDNMRALVKKATTVICLATTLHSIATGNMTPSFRMLQNNTIRPIYFYIVDISEFAVNKLSDRGSLAARGVITNVQDFIVNLCKGIVKP
jgi:lysine-ketoglutarate reductase/saccharopine dehydrogenase-like protein (TIGR00300 family)